MLWSRLAYLTSGVLKTRQAITTAVSEYKFARSPVTSSSFLIDLIQHRNYLAHPHQPHSYHFSKSFSLPVQNSFLANMPPKAAEKKPSTGGKAPVGGKAPAEKKEAGKKTAAPTGDKKKRNKTRKETYSSYIYKGTNLSCLPSNCVCGYHRRLPIF